MAVALAVVIAFFAGVIACVIAVKKGFINLNK